MTTIRVGDKQVEEILEKRGRLSDPAVDASWRISSLTQTFNSVGRGSEELLRYFPVAVVALLEGYFRARLAELIDEREEYLTKALKNYSEVRLDLGLANSIRKGTVTIGSLLLHSVPLSSLDSLIYVLQRVTGVDKIKQVLAEQKRDYPLSRVGKLYLSEPVRLWKALGRAFEVRHILAHEIANNQSIEAEEIRTLLLLTRDFLDCAEAWLSKLQHPEPKPTNQQRIAKAEESLNRSRTNFSRSLDALEVMFSKDSEEYALVRDVEEHTVRQLEAVQRLRMRSSGLFSDVLDVQARAKFERALLDRTTQEVDQLALAAEMTLRFEGK